MVTPPYPSLPTLDDLLSVQGLQHLSLFAKHAVQGPLAGYHRSPLKGFSVEFAEHRAYTPGDSLRRLDWKRLAKTDKMLIKTTDAETNLSCTVVLDRSGSMRAEHKLAFTALAVALIGEALGSQRDAIGLTLLNDDRGETVFECKTSVAHRMALYERVLSTVRESLPPLRNGRVFHPYCIDWRNRCPRVPWWWCFRISGNTNRIPRKAAWPCKKPWNTCDKKTAGFCSFLYSVGLNKRLRGWIPKIAGPKWWTPKRVRKF